MKFLRTLNNISQTQLRARNLHAESLFSLPAIADAQGLPADKFYVDFRKSGYDPKSTIHDESCLKIEQQLEHE